MRQKCVCCVVRSVPPSPFVVSVKSAIVLNVFTPTLVGPMLFLKCNTNDIGSFEFTAIALLCNVVCRDGVQSNVVYLGCFSITCRNSLCFLCPNPYPFPTGFSENTRVYAPGFGTIAA